MSTISIITPVYNGARFIEACIQVVIDQHCAEAEHIIVDGGSTDGTVDVIKRYAVEYPHIRWISEPDRGQSDAMNKGLALARGEIIGFLNADDFYAANVLNRVVDIFKTLPEPSLLVGNCNVWDDEGNLWFVNRPRRLRLTDLLLGSDVNPFPVNPSAYFYHRALIRLIGPFAVDEHYAMDLDFILRAVQVANVKYVDEVWGNFRLIVGTKTRAEIQNNNMMRRQDRMLREYQQSLPMMQRLPVVVLYLVLNSGLATTIRYFMRRPHELLPRFRARLARLWGAVQRTMRLGAI